MGGGGILPVAIKNGQVYFLFGKENELDDTPGWADFGGGAEDGESSFDTALREGSEEINGFLGSAEQLRKETQDFAVFLRVLRAPALTVFGFLGLDDVVFLVDFAVFRVRGLEGGDFSSDFAILPAYPRSIRRAGLAVPFAVAVPTA